MKSQRIFALLLLSSASQATLQRCYKSIQRKCIEHTILHSGTLLGWKSLHPTRLDHVNSPSMLPHLHGFSLAEVHEMYRSEITASVILFMYSRQLVRAEGTGVKNGSCANPSTSHVQVSLWASGVANQDCTYWSDTHNVKRWNDELQDNMHLWCLWIFHQTAAHAIITDAIAV